MARRYILPRHVTLARPALLHYVLASLRATYWHALPRVLVTKSPSLRRRHVGTAFFDAVLLGTVALAQPSFLGVVGAPLEIAQPDGFAGAVSHAREAAAVMGASEVVAALDAASAELRPSLLLQVEDPSPVPIDLGRQLGLAEFEEGDVVLELAHGARLDFQRGGAVVVVFGDDGGVAVAVGAPSFWSGASDGGSAVGHV